jgi:hypothetical protein
MQDMRKISPVPGASAETVRAHNCRRNQVRNERIACLSIYGRIEYLYRRNQGQNERQNKQADNQWPAQDRQTTGRQ